MVKRAVILLSGAVEIPTVSENDLVICADSGYLSAMKMGLTVHHLVGDMDSLPKEVLKEIDGTDVEIHTYPEDKDETDGEIALSLAVELGATDVLMLGGNTGRLDHILSTAFLPFLTQDRINVECWIGKDRLLVLREGVKITLPSENRVISILTIRSDCVVSTEGLKWELDRTSLHFGTTRGIHNEAMGEKFSIEAHSGDLFIILSDSP